ncbi:MAG: M3 family metallopeptidase [Bacteroidota bacterium]
MGKYSVLFFIAFIFIQPVLKAQPVAPTKNVLLIHSNAPIAFNMVTAATIEEATSAMIILSDERIKKITSIPAARQTAANILLAADEVLYDLADLVIKLGLISQTYTDAAARNASNEAQEKLSAYPTALLLNEDLYKAFKQFELSAASKKLPANHKKFLKETIIAFEKNGMKLDAKQREELKMINEKITNWGLQFDKNIPASKDSVKYTEAQLAGVPGNIKAPWKRANGYVVNVNGPNYTDISRYASDGETRHAMFLAYNNRAFPKNIEALDSLFYYRQVLANKLGFKSYAAYAVVDKMAASPSNVWKFENDLIAKLQPQVVSNLEELKQLKRQSEPNAPDILNNWDISYYTKKLLDTKYQLNTDEVKEYFEMNNTLKGMFTVYQKLLGIVIKETHGVPTWYEKVKSFEIFKDGKKIGTFYLDLFPRQDKYTHFACFPINQYRIANGKEILPVAALICNFPEGNGSEPSLLNHSDVITLFHEFGHLVHDMLGRSDLASQGPFNVKGDFGEAPSQFLENWCWEYDALKLFARHYKTGKLLSPELFKKMKQTQLVQSGTYYIRQVYLGVLDFTYHDKYDSIKTKDIVQVSKDLMPITQVPFAEGSHFICGFTHLNGYAANYYGYLWSRVFAQDMFSVFMKNGVMNTALGIRYRKQVLEKASSLDEMQMLRNFLGREPNSKAFLESLGLK